MGSLSHSLFQRYRVVDREMSCLDMVDEVVRELALKSPTKISLEVKDGPRESNRMASNTQSGR